MSRPVIVVATPCFGEVVNQHYTMSLLKLLCAAWRDGFDLDVLMIGGDSLINRVRSTLVARFLRNPEATHLLFVDADISFEPDQVTRLLRADKDFAACLYPLKRLHWPMFQEQTLSGEGFETAGLTYVGEPCRGDSLKTDGDFVTADYAGTGFQLIRRSVFERMIEAFPELAFRSMDVLSNVPGEAGRGYALFDCMIDEDGSYLSEDYSFCKRWRGIGGEIWLDRQSRLTHHGMASYAGDYAARSLAQAMPRGLRPLSLAA